MSDAWAALRDGARRVNRAPAIVLGLACLTLAAAIQVALTRAHADLRSGFHWLVWMAESLILEVVAQPTDAFLETKLRFGWTVSSILANVWIGVVLWIFVTGGVIDRYARDRATRAAGFFAACGVYFPRFLWLTALQIAVYALVVAAIPQILIAWLLLGAASIVADYAKVRAVVEDRRSMVGAVAAAVAFIRRNLVTAAALFAFDFALFWIVTAALRSASEMADANGALVVSGVRASWAAITILASLWLKLLFWASETALFQMKLAHAGYVARPEPVWPDSPAAEAISGTG